MATNETQTCKPCSKRSLTVSATKFCTDCDEAQCQTCTEVHNSLKACENHHVLSLEVCSSLKVERNCSDHVDMLLDFFCTAHARLCCRQCIASDHRSCDQILPIEVASKNVRKSVLFDNVRDDMNDITALFNDVLKEQNQSKAVIRDMKQNIISETKQLKKKALSKLHKMDTKIQAEIESVFGKLLEEKENGVANIEKEKKIADNFSNQLALIKEHGSEIQLFSFLYQAAPSLTCSAKTLQDIISTQKCPDVKFEAADLFPDVSSMGKIKVFDRDLSTALKPLTLKSAQDLMISKKSPTQFKLERKLKFSNLRSISGRFTGIGILKDGRLILSYFKGTHLLLIHADCQSEDCKIELGSSPWGVAVHPETDEVYVTLPILSQVHVVNVQSKAVRKISAPEKVYGITMINDKMVLGGVGKVYINAIDGTTIAKIDVGSKELYSIKSSKSSFCRSKEVVLFICETDNHRIHIVNMKNDSESVKEMSIIRVIDLERPIDSVCGLEGDMFVVCCSTNKLMRIEKDYATNEVVIEKGVLKGPFTLTFSKDYSKLYIANTSPAELLVFSCS